MGVVWNSFNLLLLLVFACSCLYLLGSGIRISTKLSSQSDCVLSHREREKMCILYVCRDLGAASLIKYAVWVSVAAEMPNRQSGREKRGLGNYSECHINRSLPASTYPLIIVALTNYVFSLRSASTSPPFYFIPHPLNSSPHIPIHGPSHSLFTLSHFHQIGCHSVSQSPAARGEKLLRDS